MNNSPRRIPIKLEHSPYEVVIGGLGLNGISEELYKAGIKKKTKVLVVTNPDIAELYGDICLNNLEQNGYITSLIILEAGESQKTPKTISLIHDAAHNSKLERSSLMIALGGGVIGDMTGFAAATWLRGISVIQVPTTLLAMVDASIGGKTGVNHPGGKNLIGSFHQPKLVLIDPSTLNSLPEREFKAGMAEVIKYGIIGDRSLFELLENSSEADNLSSLGKDLLENIIERSALAKAKIVLEDEHEAGLRAVLNYGHTFGHVVETLCGYGTWLHGEAVAIGMATVGELAVRRKNWKKEDAKRQNDLIEKMGLPTKWPLLDKDSVLRTLQGDKKVRDGMIRFVIPTEIGKVEICDNISEREIINLLEELN